MALWGSQVRILSAPPSETQTPAVSHETAGVLFPNVSGRRLLEQRLNGGSVEGLKAGEETGGRAPVLPFRSAESGQAIALSRASDPPRPAWLRNEAMAILLKPEFESCPGARPRAVANRRDRLY